MKKSIGSGRGSVYTIILKALQTGDKYGYEICKEIEEKSNGTYILKQPSLYSGLKRLEAQKDVKSYWGDSEIGGRRHYYSLTEKGLERISKTNFSWEDARDNVIDNIFEQSEEEKSIKQLKNDINFVQNDINEIQKLNEEIDSKLNENYSNKNVVDSLTLTSDNVSSNEKPVEQKDTKIQRHEVNPSQQDLFSFFGNADLYNNSTTPTLAEEETIVKDNEDKQSIEESLADENNFNNTTASKNDDLLNDSKIDALDNVTEESNVTEDNTTETNENISQSNFIVVDEDFNVVENGQEVETLENKQPENTLNDENINSLEEINTDKENDNTYEKEIINNQINEEFVSNQKVENNKEDKDIQVEEINENIASTNLPIRENISSVTTINSEKSVINVNDYLKENLSNNFLTNDVENTKFYEDDIFSGNDNTTEETTSTLKDEQDELYEKFLNSLKQEEIAQKQEVLPQVSEPEKTNIQNELLQNQEPKKVEINNAENFSNSSNANNFANSNTTVSNNFNANNNSNANNGNLNPINSNFNTLQNFGVYSAPQNEFSQNKQVEQNLINTETIKPTDVVNQEQTTNAPAMDSQPKTIINNEFVNKKQDDIDYKSIFGDFIQETKVEPIEEPNQEPFIDTKEMFNEYNETNFSKGTDLPRVNVADNINLSLKPKETEQVYKSPFKSYHDDEAYESKDNYLSSSSKESETTFTPQETVPFDVKYSASQLNTEDYSVRRYEKIDIKNLESKYMNFGKFNLIACISFIIITLLATLSVQLLVFRNIIKFSKLQNQLVAIFYILALLCLVYAILYQIFNKNKRKLIKVSLSKPIILTFLVAVLEVIIVVANLMSGIKVNELINCYSSLIIPTIINVLLILDFFILCKIKRARFLYK